LSGLLFFRTPKQEARLADVQSCMGRWLRFNPQRLIQLALALFLVVTHTSAFAKYVVLNARGGGYKAGQTIAEKAVIELKEGERLTIIGADGKSITHRGPYSGPPSKGPAAANDPKKALAILISSRDARTSSIGVVRAGTDAVKTPDPFAIDITRAGPRCLFEGEKPILWRPDASRAQPFVIFPIDRSWRADLNWEVGQDRLVMPDLSRFEGVTTLLVNIDQQEFALSFSVIPKGIDDPVILTAWMLEKGCIQQGDALLRQLAQASQ
jgi:hypothetical protein